MQKRVPKASIYAIAITLALALAVVVAAAFLGRNLYLSALADGKQQADRFTKGAQAAVNRSFLSVDMLLGNVTRLLELQTPSNTRLHSAWTDTLLQTVTRQNMLVRNVWLLDTHGRVLYSSLDGPASDAPALPPGFVQHVLQSAPSNLLISQPTPSHTSPQQVLHFARLVHAQGSDPLLAVAEVPEQLLTTILVQGAEINQLEVHLERGNGQLLMPALPREWSGTRALSPPLGQAVAPGTLEPWATQVGPARLSQRPAIVAARPLMYDDVFVSAAIPMDTVLGDWYFQVQLIVLVALVLIVLIVAAGVSGLRHIHALRGAKRSIAKAKALTDQALESMESGFLLLDAQRNVVMWNQRYAQMYPWQLHKLKVGAAFTDLLMATAQEILGCVQPEVHQQWVSSRMALMTQGIHSHEREYPNGRIIEITERDTPDGGLVIVYQDVTRLRRASAEIEQLAFFDPLTGLPNRRMLNDRLQQAIAAAERHQRHGAVLFLDLDNFKTLNDTMGHDVGDLLLQQVAQRIQRCVRESDTVAHLSGDEFVVLLQDLSPEIYEATLQTQRAAHTILHALSQPYALRNTQYRSSCSAGACLFGNTQHSAADLLKQADIAMYQVKNTGRNALCFYDPQMLQAIEQRATLEADLRSALAQSQFELFYQLQASDTGKPLGAEALVRWRHPINGLVMPSAFIGLCEETGLIVPLGQWILEQSCAQLRAWAALPHTAHLQLSVNVSARQFGQHDFVDFVRDLLHRTGVNPALLKLELTESLVLDNVEGTIEKMHALKALGVRFSMDDFGTGHSSLSYLTRLPLDQLKIDQSFVHNIGLRDTDALIIQTIIGMGNNLGLEVLAEGVETAAQRDFLARHGCHICQGYLFSRPLPVREFSAALL